MLKPKAKKEIIERNTKTRKAFNIPEIIWAIKYSAVESGEINIFDKFLDQIFHRAPTDIEY